LVSNKREGWVFEVGMGIKEMKGMRRDEREEKRILDPDRQRQGLRDRNME
jgi:hypothetical protein